MSMSDASDAMRDVAADPAVVVSVDFCSSGAASWYSCDGAADVAVEHGVGPAVGAGVLVVQVLADVAADVGDVCCHRLLSSSSFRLPILLVQLVAEIAEDVRGHHDAVLGGFFAAHLGDEAVDRCHLSAVMLA